MFYVPECGEEYDRIKRKIEDHGGLVVEQHECGTYQLKPDNVSSLKQKDYYAGKIYVENWITEAIEKNDKTPNSIYGKTLLSRAEDHELFTNESQQCKRLNIGKKKRFTISEGLKLFSIMSTTGTQNLSKSSFWQKVAE